MTLFLLAALCGGGGGSAAARSPAGGPAAAAALVLGASHILPCSAQLMEGEACDPGMDRCDTTYRYGADGMSALACTDAGMGGFACQAAARGLRRHLQAPSGAPAGGAPSGSGGSGGGGAAVDGCMDTDAENFDPAATQDDGSCDYAGCIDASAENYDDWATADDGSCTYASPSPPPSGTGTGGSGAGAGGAPSGSGSGSPSPAPSGSGGSGGGGSGSNAAPAPAPPASDPTAGGSGGPSGSGNGVGSSSPSGVSCNSTEVDHSDFAANGSLSGSFMDSVTVTCDDGYSGGGTWLCTPPALGSVFTGTGCSVCSIGVATGTYAGLSGGSGVMKYNGVVVAPNGKLYFIPSGARSVLIVDPQLQTSDEATISGLSTQ